MAQRTIRRYKATVRFPDGREFRVRFTSAALVGALVQVLVAGRHVTLELTGTPLYSLHGRTLHAVQHAYL
ncbi:hypothetical protein ABZT43_51345 [Streptomyces sp. NPDC005349]|uniref:hypothetical protein n=1 Tax=Streptomyces sp. NPDC005349 TaxID=3157037 RepID=UPI0033A802F4